MNLPEGSSETLSQLGEGNFTPHSTFLSYLRRKKEARKQKQQKRFKTKQNRKLKLTGKRAFRKWLGNAAARERHKR